MASVESDGQDTTLVLERRGDHNLQHVEIKINGLRCVELIRIPPNLVPAIANQRRREKDLLGKKNPEVPMIYCKTGNRGKKEYNDGMNMLSNTMRSMATLLKVKTSMVEYRE